MRYFAGSPRQVISIPPTAGAPVDNPATVPSPSHGFVAGQPLYQDSTGFHLAVNQSAATLAYYLVSNVTLDSITFAKHGDIVDGFTGLSPGDWYHSSPTTPGAIAPVGITESKPIGAFSANPIGQALTTTSLCYLPTIPYQTS
jgi:hypothetical protein